MSTVAAFRVVKLSLPLVVPYKLSYRTFTEFEPFVVMAYDDAGASGIGEGHISPGSSSETRDGGWQFLQANLPGAHGKPVHDAIAGLRQQAPVSPVAATAAISALEMLGGNRLLDRGDELSLPLLSPVNGDSQSELEAELAGRLEEGFGTFKIKVGLNVDADLKRVALIQSILKHRASLRIDANRAYSTEDAIRFATSIDPDSVELFEQPCDAADWEANAAVARVSRVPLMLDEPICALEDIRRAQNISGVGYCKVKLKRFGSIDALQEAIRLIRECGMKPVLGDGLGAEIACWMEACVARDGRDGGDGIDNAGEFNGYLKTATSLLQVPLGFNNGRLTAPAGYRPSIDRDAFDKAAVDEFSIGAVPS